MFPPERSFALGVPLPKYYSFLLLPGVCPWSRPFRFFFGAFDAACVKEAVDFLSPGNDFGVDSEPPLLSALRCFFFS